MQWIVVLDDRCRHERWDKYEATMKHTQGGQAHFTLSPMIVITLGSDFHGRSLQMKYENKPCKAKVGKDTNAWGL